MLLWSGLPWVVSMGGFPLAVIVTWWTIKHAIRPGWRRFLSAVEAAAYLARRMMSRRVLPATHYEAPIFASGAAADLVVISDLHVTAQPDRHSLEHDAFDRPVHDFVDRLLPAFRPQACLLAGDLTDTGSSDAWRRLRERFQPWRREGVDLMAVAGNHDVHYRRLEIAAERLGIPGVGGYFKALVQHPSAAGACSHPADRTARRLARLTGKPVERLAPRLHRCDKLGADFLLLDSNQRPSHSPVSQAIGFVGQTQLVRAQQLLDALPERRPLYIVMHHHLLPPGPAARDQPLLACIDAEEVLAFAERNEVEAVFHGHLHMPYVATHVYAGADRRSRVMRIVSCGSALFPAEGIFASEVGEASAVAVQMRDGRIEELGFVPASRVQPDADRSLDRVRHQGKRRPDQSTKVPEESGVSSPMRASMPATDSSI